jgi:hypothetical protein
VVKLDVATLEPTGTLVVVVRRGDAALRQDLEGCYTRSACPQADPQLALCHPPAPGDPPPPLPLPAPHTHGHPPTLQEPPFFAGVVVNYTRALFGTLPDCEDMLLGVGDPITACAPLRGVAAGNRTQLAATTAEVGATGAVASLGGVTRMAVVVDRGSCRFEDKAVNVAAAGGTLAIVGNQANVQVRAPPRVQWWS